jgi:LuxR family transcriptional regulator
MADDKSRIIESRDAAEPLPLVEFLHRALATTAIEDVWALHVDQMAAYGFDRLLYASSRLGPVKGVPRPAESLVLSTLPPDYLRDFVDGGLYLVAPMVWWAVENTGARPFARTVEQGRCAPLSPCEQRLQSLEQRFGIDAGYTISFPHTSCRARGCIGLYAPPDCTQDEVDDIWHRHGKELSVMNTVVHTHLTTLPSRAPAALTCRQREVLEWVAWGLTTQEIASKIGLTAATVEKHLRLAREALGVETTTQAVLHAAIHNHLFPSRG